MVMFLPIVFSLSLKETEETGSRREEERERERGERTAYYLRKEGPIPLERRMLHCRDATYVYIVFHNYDHGRSKVTVVAVAVVLAV